MLVNELIWIDDDNPEETLDDLLARSSDIEEDYVMDYDQFTEVVVV